MRTRRVAVWLGAVVLVWLGVLLFLATLQMEEEVSEEEALLSAAAPAAPLLATTQRSVNVGETRFAALLTPPLPPPAPMLDSADDGAGDGLAESSGAVVENATSNSNSIVAAARSRVADEASHADDGADDGDAPAAKSEHSALQGAAVELLTAQSECGIQTYANRGTARASSIFTDDDADGALAASRYGPARAFDTDTATSFHGACGLPSAPWWLTYRFAEPTTVSTIRLTADAPSDYPKTWELQARVNAHEPFVTLLRVSKDAGIACSTKLRQFRCDQPRVRSYEVRSPGDYREYRLMVHAVTNTKRRDRHCLQLAEVAFVGPCASSNLVLHLDASAITAPVGSLIAEWRDQSGHGHHARRRGTANGAAAGSSNGGPDDSGGIPLALPDSASFDVAEASEAPPLVDDGGSPRLEVDPRSGRGVLSWDYQVGGGFLEAAGLTVGPKDSLTVFVVASTRSNNWPSRGSKVKPIYCLGDPAFFAGTLCLAGVVGNHSTLAYGGRGQPGEGEYTSGLSEGGMDGDGLHVLAVTLNGKEGLYRGYFDGLPAHVPSFLSRTTPSIGVAHIGGSSSSRSRRFHGTIAEVVHYNKVLTLRQMHAIGHYLQHKYHIKGAYTDERAAISDAESGGALGIAGGAGALPNATGTDSRLAQLQLMLPPASGCVSHRGGLKKVALEPCEEGRAGQYWEWNGAEHELRFAAEPSQCLAWYAEEATFGAWPCEFAEAEFTFEPLAHRFCLVSAPTRCVSQLIAAVPLQLRPANDDGTTIIAPHHAGLAGTAAAGVASGVARPAPPQCLTLVQARAPLQLLPCSEASTAQLWEYDAVSLELHASNDKSLCLDYFVDQSRWGVWECHHATNEQFRSQAPRLDAYCATFAGTRGRGARRCVSVHRSENVFRLLADGGASCLEFRAPLQPLAFAPCSHTPRQLWRLDDHGGLHYARDASLCIDRFSSGGGQWGAWTCDPEHKPNQRFTDIAAESSQKSGSGSVVTSGRLCIGEGTCVQVASPDGAVMLSVPGDVRCAQLSPEETVNASPSLLRPSKNSHDEDEDEDEDEEDEEEFGLTGDGVRVISAACANEESTQRWMYNATRSTFSALGNSSLCLELSLSFSSAAPDDGEDSDAVAIRAAPCLASEPPTHSGVGSAAAAGLVARNGGAAQRFEWDQATQRFCASLYSATRFRIQRCVAAATSSAGVTVALLAPREADTARGRHAAVEASGAPPACFHVTGKFRMLESAPCAAGEARQRWSYDAAAGTFRAVTEASQCLRYFAEAKSFGVWACDGIATFRPSKAAQGGGGGRERAFCAEPEASGGGQAVCVSLAPES